MKIISWNINGIRAVIKKGFLDFLKKEKPDILCLQEIKICEKAREKENISFPGYEVFWNSATRPGYSGTAILIKSTTQKKNKFTIENGLGIEKFDTEGRTQVLEAGDFYLINNYFPNANHELSRLSYRLEFNNALLKKAKKMENPSTGSRQGKPVIVCGDFNVAHEEIDLARPKDNVGNPGFTYEERDWMTKFLSQGFVDTYRHFFPDGRDYTWWSYRFGARARDIGWRIDYFCASDKIIRRINKPFIKKDILGSDHCPVGVFLK